LPNVLTHLKDAGSGAAAMCLDEMQHHKVQISKNDTGATLFNATFGLRVRPDRFGYLWLTNHQIQSLREFIAAADDDPADIERDIIEVEPIRPQERRNVLTLVEAEVKVSYLGRSTVIPATPTWARGQRLDVILDGAPAGLITAALWKLGSLAPSTMRSLPARLVLPAAAADCLGILLHLRLADKDDVHDAAVVGWALAVATGFALAVPKMQYRFRMSDGSPLFPATAGSLGAAVALGNYWSQLGRWRLPALGLLMSLPTLGAHRSIRTMRSVLWETAFTVMAFGSTLRLQERADEERALVVDGALTNYLSHVALAAAVAGREELDWYATQIAIARRELRRLRLQLGDLAEDLLLQTKQAEQWVRSQQRLLPGERSS
jgi:hypothetical protein